MGSFRPGMDPRPSDIFCEFEPSQKYSGLKKYSGLNPMSCQLLVGISCPTPKAWPPPGWTKSWLRPCLWIVFQTVALCHVMSYKIFSSYSLYLVSNHIIPIRCVVASYVNFSALYGGKVYAISMWGKLLQPCFNMPRPCGDGLSHG